MCTHFISVRKLAVLKQKVKFIFSPHHSLSELLNAKSIIYSNQDIIASILILSCDVRFFFNPYVISSGQDLSLS